MLSSGSYTLAFTENVENLTLLGSGNLEGHGNALANTLTGNTGLDTLIGGDGNDTYVVQVANTAIIERAGAVAGKVDSVLASVSVTLADNVERLTLTGTDAIDGTGNDLLNLITGNAKANVLDGGLGSDILKGGSGLDTFVFSTALGPTNIDRITDFSVGREKIHLDHAVFSALAVGNLDPTQFKDISNGGKYDADDRIVYRADKSALYYDADGYGGTAKAVAFAVLDTHPTNLTAADILVV